MVFHSKMEMRFSLQRQPHRSNMMNGYHASRKHSYLRFSTSLLILLNRVGCVLIKRAQVGPYLFASKTLVADSPNS